MDQNKKSLEDNVDNGPNVETVSAIEKIFCNPGLQHIIEEIFWHLKIKEICAFQKVNKTCKEFVNDPRIWQGIRRRIRKQREKRIAREKRIKKNCPKK